MHLLALAKHRSAVFEIHPNPEKALCDGPNMLKLDEVKPLFKKLKEIYNLVRKND